MEREASEVVREVAAALVFLHENGIAHRDLKPQNVLCVKKNQVSIMGSEGLNHPLPHPQPLLPLPLPLSPLPLPLPLSISPLSPPLSLPLPALSSLQIIPVRICDFDLSSMVVNPATPNKTPVLFTPVGSVEFMAPEVVETFRGDVFSYDKKCDLWSLGVRGILISEGGMYRPQCSWDLKMCPY